MAATCAKMFVPARATQTRGFSFGRGQRNTHNCVEQLCKRPLVQRVSALRDPGRHVDRSLNKGPFVMENRNCAPWSDEEKKFIKDHYLSMTHDEIGKHLGRTVNGVRNLCHENKWRKRFDEWTDDEVILLRESYRDGEPVDLQLLADKLGRLRSNICRKARELGLTHQGRPWTREHLQHNIETHVGLWKRHPHPRGHAGHTHSPETRKRMSAGIRRAYENPNHPLRSEEQRQRRSDYMSIQQREGKMRNGYSRGRMGKRDDLNGLYVRSAWEANYARYLNWLVSLGEIKSWEYEADCFEFTAIKRGTRSYLPDFKVTNPDGSIEYHEVKGWMDDKSRVKLNRMAKYYPDVKVILIDEDAYKAIASKVRHMIEGWERG